MFKITDMSKVELVAISGRGKGLSEFVANCLTMNIGEGTRISKEQYDKGKGVASVYAAGNRRNMKFMVRRDTKGHIWLFRVKLVSQKAA